MKIDVGSFKNEKSEIIGYDSEYLFELLLNEGQVLYNINTKNWKTVKIFEKFINILLENDEITEDFIFNKNNWVWSEWAYYTEKDIKTNYKTYINKKTGKFNWDEFIEDNRILGNERKECFIDMDYPG